MSVQRISHDLTRRLLSEVPPLLTEYGSSCLFDKQAEGWKVYVVNQSRGRCYYARKILTVPVWAFNEDKYNAGYRSWYLGHELSHSLAGGSAGHGPIFMAKLKEVVRPEHIHYEHGYKPRHAAAAGVPLADGSIPTRAMRATRTSLHPQSVINAKNLYLYNTLGVRMLYLKSRKCWVCISDDRRIYGIMCSNEFARTDRFDLRRWAERKIELDQGVKS